MLGRFAMVTRAQGRNASARPATIQGYHAAARVLNVVVATRADHVVEEGLPHGCAVEAMLAEALLRADRLATDADDREHVTSMMRRDRACFNSMIVSAPAHVRRPHLRLTVDTRADLDFVREVAAELGNTRKTIRSPRSSRPPIAWRSPRPTARFWLRNGGSCGDQPDGGVRSSGPVMHRMRVARTANTRADREVVHNCWRPRNYPKVAA